MQSGTTDPTVLNLTKMLIITILGCVLANEGLADRPSGPRRQEPGTLPLMGCSGYSTHKNPNKGCQEEWYKKRYCKGIDLEEACMNLTICDRGPNPPEKNIPGGGPPRAVCTDEKACTKDDECMRLGDSEERWHAVRTCQDGKCLWDGEIRDEEGDTLYKG